MCLPPRLPSDVFDRLYHLPDPTHDPTNENHYKSLAILVALKQPKFLCRHVILQRAKGMEYHSLPWFNMSKIQIWKSRAPNVISHELFTAKKSISLNYSQI